MSGDRTAAAVDRRHLRVGLLAVALVVVITYLAFAGPTLFGGSRELRGNFSSATQLKPGSSVRLAGVGIGEVTRVQPARAGSATVTMRLDQPVEMHQDATLAIKPRLLFEGNFYVDVKAGTSGAPPLPAGSTIPLASTSVPVQADQVLSVLTTPARAAMQTIFAELSEGLGGKRGPRGYEGLRQASKELDGALGSTRRAAAALQGSHPGDLHRAIASGGDVTAQLGRDPEALAGVVANFNRVTAALAADPGALAAGIRELDSVLRAAPRSLASLDSALPVLTNFADHLRPALRAAPASLRRTADLMQQLQAAGKKGELPALIDRLDPVTSSLPDFESGLGKAMPLIGSAGDCLTQTVLPTINREIPDGETSSGRPVWQDLMHMGSNLTQTSPGFDGNGGTLRISIAESENSLAGVFPGIGELSGQGDIQGVRPVWLGYGKDPEFRPDQWCDRQEQPDLGARSRPGRPPGISRAPMPKLSANAQQLQEDLAHRLAGSDSSRLRVLRELLGGKAQR
ncbi:MAG: phospholipid/cholesterol/gamma-HCH transport system substrate-binding protein [Thermoleophilaceae bacterium]|jgi:virulence factor Mce-like protein|nr:phospholipid/cholesterol/gamma-HCH transport system substrate-binding protein [Thermoleophilaceae bacterium]